MVLECSAKFVFIKKGRNDNKTWIFSMQLNVRNQWALFLLYCRTNVRLFFATLLQKELNSKHIPPSITHEKKPCNLTASLCGQRWKGKGKGKGEFGRARGPFYFARAQIPPSPSPSPSPSPFNAGHADYLIAIQVRTWVVIETRNIAIQLVMRQCCKTNCVLVRVASCVKRQVSRYVLRHCFTDCLMLGTKATNIK